MKKAFCILLLCFLLPGICACGDKQQQENPASEQPSAESPASSAPVEDASADPSRVQENFRENPPTSPPAETGDGFVFTGEPAEPFPICQTKEYADDKERTLYIFSFAEDGSTLSVATRIADEENEPTDGWSLVRFTTEGRISSIENASGIRALYTYEGDIGHVEAYDAENTLLEKRAYTYNAKGEVLLEQLYSPDDVLQMEATYTYDELGRTTSALKRYVDGAVYSFSLSYDNEQRTMEETVLLNDDFYTANIFRYDQYDNKIHMDMYDKQPPATPAKSFDVQNEYDESGLLLRSTCLSAEDKSEAYRTEYSYTQTRYAHYYSFIKNYYSE